MGTRKSPGNPSAAQKGEVDSYHDLSFNSSVQRSWKIWLLVFVMLTIAWILIVPNADLDPCPPLNLEIFYFAVLALCILLDCGTLLQVVWHGLFPRTVCRQILIPSALVSRIAPLRC